MNSRILGLRVAGTLFGLMSVAQLTRLLLGVEVVAAGHRVPLWLSAIAFVVLASLSVWLWKISYQRKS